MRTAALVLALAAALTFAPSVIDRAIRNRRRQARAARLAFWDDVIEEALRDGHDYLVCRQMERAEGWS